MKILLRIVFLSILFYENECWLNNVPSTQEMIHCLQNLSTSFDNYMKKWTESHDSVPAEALGYKNFDCDFFGDSFDIEPANVHMLRPEDIGVIAALGDSLTAGNGAGGVRLIDVDKQYRGLSFPIGGDGKLENTLTLPNIFRKYNPRIYGASKRESSANFEAFSRLNVAVPGSRAKDMPAQAMELVKRLRKSSKRMAQWKVVTLFIGSNDVCGYCMDKPNGHNLSDPTPTWINEIGTAVDILSKGLSKVFLNLVSVPSVGASLRQYENDPICKFLHELECPCITSGYEIHSITDDVIRKYQSGIYNLTSKFERWDFTVVVQPFLSNTLVPRNNKTNEPDLSYLAPDCFHFSQRSHAAAAAYLWNNMFQTLEEKNGSIDATVVKLQCPDKNCPFLRTSVNSHNCSIDHIIVSISPKKASFLRNNAKTLRVADTEEIQPANAKRTPGPAIWIFVGILVALILGIVILYCTWKGGFGKKKIQPKMDETTPLLMRSMDNLDR